MRLLTDENIIFIVITVFFGFGLIRGVHHHALLFLTLIILILLDKNI